MDKDEIRQLGEMAYTETLAWLNNADIKYEVIQIIDIALGYFNWRLQTDADGVFKGKYQKS